MMAEYTRVDLEKKRRERALAKAAAENSGESKQEQSGTPQGAEGRHDYEQMDSQAESKNLDRRTAKTQSKLLQVESDVPAAAQGSMGNGQGAIQQLQDTSSTNTTSQAPSGGAPKVGYTMILKETLDSSVNPGAMRYEDTNIIVYEPESAKKRKRPCTKQALYTALVLLILTAMSACLAFLFFKVFSLDSRLLTDQQSLLCDTDEMWANLSLLSDQYCTVTDCRDQHQVVSNVIGRLQELNNLYQLFVDTLDSVGQPSNPAASCAALLVFSPSTPSGHYWVKTANGSAIRVYCDMTLICGNVTGGWTKVAELNMTNTDSQCPGDSYPKFYSGIRTCGIPTTSIIPGRCSEATFNTMSLRYTRVCGRITAYQFGTPEAFHSGHDININNIYMDGVSLTHGTPREHIWTFAAASNVSNNTCPCSRNDRIFPPELAFVQDHYFCDAASPQLPASAQFYPNNSLWDGEDCGVGNQCCHWNSPPWFYRDLEHPTTDNIDMRACVDEFRHIEDIPIEAFEIYVQ